MKSKLTYFLTGIGAAILLWFLLFTKGCLPQHEIQYTTTDTIFVDKPYKEVVIKEVEKPVRVFVYRTDTIYRKSIEKDTLITSVEITPERAKIHTITPKGLPLIKEYPVMDFKEIKLDHEGNTQVKKRKHPKRRKALKFLGKVAIFTGGFILGSKTAK